jgi:hypothetical protein
MYAFDAPLVARFFAIEELRAAGWKHRLEPAVLDLPERKREDAERIWSGATYCPECAARARARAASKLAAGAAPAAGVKTARARERDAGKEHERHERYDHERYEKGA